MISMAGGVVNYVLMALLAAFVAAVRWAGHRRGDGRQHVGGDGGLTDIMPPEERARAFGPPECGFWRRLRSGAGLGGLLRGFSAELAVCRGGGSGGRQSGVDCICPAGNT